MRWRKEEEDIYSKLDAMDNVENLKPPIVSPESGFTTGGFIALTDARFFLPPLYRATWKLFNCFNCLKTECVRPIYWSD